jgi:PAS domain S-box-containing protein
MPTRAHNTKADRELLSTGKSTAESSEKLWGFVFDALPEAISIHTSTGEIMWANRKLCELYCKSLSELRQMDCSKAFHQADSACPHEEVMAAGHPVHLADDLKVSGKTLSVTIEPLFDESNQPWGFMRVMRDVTQERNAQEQLLSAERFATLGQLFSGVAHDVGTPLNVISGYAEFLLMRKRPEDPGYKELTAILDQTRRIAAIFGEALDLSRPAQSRTDAIDLNVLMAEALARVGHHLRKSDVKADLTCRMPKPLIYGEASQLKQAFFNLLLNASQRVGTGGRLKLVIVEAAELQGFVEIVLWGTDGTGVGLDFSTSLRGSLAGECEIAASGTGLHLTRKILVDAGARIRPAQAEEECSALVIQLPAKVVTSSER